MSSPTRSPSAAGVSPATDNGFTVVEMLVALAIMTVVMVPTLLLLQNATRAESVHFDQVAALQDGTVAYEWLSSDIRSATAIGLRGSTVLELSRLDNNGNAEFVAWTRDGDVLIRSASDGRETLSKTRVLDDLDPRSSVAPFTMRDLKGGEVRSDASGCATSLDVQLDRMINGEGDSLVFSVALRALDRTGVTC